MAVGMVDGAPVPDTAMDTKSEEGAPGGTSDTTPLTDDENALLERLRDGDGTPAEPAAEESPAYGRAVDDDSPVPGSPPGAGRPDPLDPVFREPGP
jgi:hypothetical protein